MGSTKIKICGIKSRNDIQVINEVLPDYIGFMFAKSSRMITEETAGILRAYLHPLVTTVGVFVNEEIDKIIRLCSLKIIDIIQLHGDEGADYIKKLKKELPNRIIKAVRVKGMQDIQRAGVINCDYLLLDSFKDNMYGGSGTSFDWSVIREVGKPYFLAGGINQSNVLQAINEYHPYCVDVSSGVETDGRKDGDKIRKLVSMIRSVS